MAQCSLNFSSSKKVFIFPSFLKDNLSGNRILGWKLFFSFFLSTLQIFHSTLLVHVVSKAKVEGVLIFYSLSFLPRFLLSLIFHSLNRVRPSVVMGTLFLTNAF